MSPLIRVSVPVASPSTVFGFAGSMVRSAVAIPVAAFEAFRALPDLADVIRGLSDPDGPLRQIDDAILAIAGLKDIALALNKISDMAVALDRLAELQDELETLGNMQASLATIALLEAPVRSLAKTTESLPDLAEAAEALPRLVDQVHSVQAVVSHIGDRIDELTPALHQIAEFGVGLESEIDDLGAALAPISTIASKLPGGRRKAREIAREQAAGRSATAAPTPRIDRP
ncbi:MAG: hypothetical protein Q7T55_19810 [Solirubrobacteraceae bacterium]|nr:hypothetical protein [Solirubrobacteraceae bacterium]